MESKVSIIVPIYNVEKYLARCIESILNQTYKNIEIILVDDGSPDNCGEIVDEYQRFDSRIVAIHKKNGGLSDARNVGMVSATGEYIFLLTVMIGLTEGLSNISLT
ncbi:glycosyltransferase family 2 protein [Litchfieldia alkalitelluris]|uniref:glycosyltransferase family 2 protein n=1 Tax=Litchfieldia alkalitelluris TaxID=304268 RepID=UPI001F1D7CDD|nr:glycosyltransferase family A protein [Litchfieldia alkalitelluris]